MAGCHLPEARSCASEAASRGGAAVLLLVVHSCASAAEQTRALSAPGARLRADWRKVSRPGLQADECPGAEAFSKMLHHRESVCVVYH